MILYILQAFMIHNCYNLKMDLAKRLTKEEGEEYTKLKNTQNGMDQKTLELCLTYFLEYKNNLGYIANEKLSIVLKSALFMAQKSQNIQTVKGERITLPSLTLANLLKSHHLDEVMITLKDLSKNVKINDKEAALELNNLIKEISFLITFHKKFEKSIEKLDLKERNAQGKEDYLKNWSSFAWLLYILVKNNVLHKSHELIENTCMLAHTLAFMLSLGWEYLIPRAILRQEKKINEESTLKQVLPFLRDRVLEMFSIKTLDVYATFAGQFERYFEEQLTGKNIIKSLQNHADFLSHQLIVANTKRLDKFYEKNLNCSDLDQRIFLKERTNNLTPSKFTPFALQGYANKGRKNKNDTTYKQNYSSHRLLNFQLIDKQETITKPINECNIAKLPKNIMISPSSTIKTPLICATPVTAGMEMYNYVNEKARKFKQMLGQGQAIKRSYESSVVRYIEVLYEKGRKDFDKKTKQLRQGLIYSFFKLGLEEYLASHPTDKDNEPFYRAMMAMSIQIVLFVSNSSLTFEDVEIQLKTSPFQLWKACDFYLKFDKAMPSALKLHLLDLQVGLVSYKLWRNEESIQGLHSIINELKKQQRSTYWDKLFRRLLHQTAFQINQLCNSLKIEDSIIENIYQILKNIYREHTDLLFGRSIDQLIMCSIFSLSRKEKLDVKFTEVIEVYQDMNPHNKDIHDQMIYKIALKDRQPINLISYYNEFFIHPLKDFILNLKAITSELKKHYNPASIMMSPLRDILPREINNKKIAKKATKDGNINLLYAYTDSPLLKHEPMAFKGHNLQSRRIIDFDQEEEKFYKKYDEEKENECERVPPQNFVNLPPEIAKKFSAPSVNNNCAWKAPISNGLTPTRMNKNNQNIQLNQFSTNPTPAVNTRPALTKNNQMGATFSKGLSRMTYL